MSRLPLVRSPLLKDKDTDGFHISKEDDVIFEDPKFAHYEATSNIQLFFDLFFVANLTSFTNAHEINSRHNLVSYIGFIAILWFTWAQVTLYDIRFATDSVVSRFAHACHFGVMVGLAISGYSFLESHDDWGNQQQMSLILMSSSIVLLFQYGTTLFFTWRYKSTRTPLIIIMVSLFIAFAIYLGISFAFQNHTSYYAYIAWYVVSVTLVIINVAVAAFWPVVSLYKAHLVERMSCLTLIILGEGIIGLTKTLVKVEGLDSKFTAEDIGMIISAVLIIYIVYQLYFDNICLDALSHVQQHLWAVLHFPFHLALCLMMEGMNQTLLWTHIIEDMHSIYGPLSDVIDADTFSTADLKTTLQEAVTTIFEKFEEEITDDVYNDIQKSLNATLALPNNSTENTTLETAITAITESGKVLFDSFGWETATEPLDEGLQGFLNEEHGVLSVFNLTFGYFVICTGLIFILTSVFSLLSSKHDRDHYRLRYLSTGINILIGVGLTLLSTMTLTDSAINLAGSKWFLPGLMLIMLALLVIHHLPEGRYESVVKEHDPEHGE